MASLPLKSGGSRSVGSRSTQADFGWDAGSALITFGGRPTAGSGPVWMTSNRLLKIHALLLDNPQVTVVKSELWNPVVLLTPEEDSDPLDELHDCLDVVDAQTKAREDLKNQPLDNADNIWFTDGSSFMHGGTRRTGWAVVSKLGDLVALGALPASCSAQRAELEAGSLTLYTDSKYLWGVVHGYGRFWQEQGLLTAAGTPVKHGAAIDRLFVRNSNAQTSSGYPLPWTPTRELQCDPGKSDGGHRHPEGCTGASSRNPRLPGRTLLNSRSTLFA